MRDHATFLITGAARGLGRALTDAVLARGHNVVATVRGDNDLPPSDRLLVHRLDVRDRAAAGRAVAAAVYRFGSLDVVVNNAGYGLVGAIEEVSETEVREIVDTDLLGALWMTQAALPVMRAQASGHIVQISTVGAVGTVPTLGMYNAVKWGLEGFSEALAAEVASFGIRVTIVEPGELDTEWSTGSMRFSAPIAAYDELRKSIFGSPVVPWPAVGGSAGSGMAPADAAARLLDYLAHPETGRTRILLGDDAPGQVGEALARRRASYAADPDLG